MGRSVACALLVVAAGCSKSTVDPGPEPAPVKTRNAKSGFSADLATDLADEPGSAAGPRTNANGTAGAHQQAVPPGASAVVVVPVVVPDAGAGVVVALDAAKVVAAVAPPEPPPERPPPVAPVPVPPVAVAPVAVAAKPGPVPAVAPPSPAAVMSPELQAIKLTLAPNWDRDKEAPATFSLFVKATGATPAATFLFHYGYEDPRAPTDREAYKKWLTDQKVLTVLQDRQAGASWYLQGTDAHGPAFRIVVAYGGKKHVCYGSLYHDAASDKLGDLRDDVVVDAKKICETITL